MHKIGYGTFITNPGETAVLYCRVCGAECEVERNVLGPTGFASAMGGTKTLHDRFHCPNIDIEWHETALRLVVAIEESPSKRVRELMQLDLEDILREHAVEKSGEQRYTVITDPAEYLPLQKQLEDLLVTLLSRKIQMVAGFPSGSMAVDAFTNGKLWYTHQFLKDVSRHWNAFGFDPIENQNNNIVVEINIPVIPDGRVGGVFVRQTSTGKIYLMHRGKIGGGRKGIGKTAFFKWLQKKEPGLLVEVEEGDRMVKVIRVAELSEARILSEITNFVRQVDEFKKITVGNI